MQIFVFRQYLVRIMPEMMDITINQVLYYSYYSIFNFSFYTKLENNVSI